MRNNATTEIPRFVGTKHIAAVVNCSRRSIQLAIRSGVLAPDAFFETPKGTRVAGFLDSNVDAMVRKMKGTL